MIYGKKTGLRAVETTDLKQLQEWRNLSEFRRNFREHRELSMSDQASWYENISSSSSDYMFIIENLDNDPQLIGACGLLYTNWISRYADFSFYIGKDKSYIDNEGYAKDASLTLFSTGVTRPFSVPADDKFSELTT